MNYIKNLENLILIDIILGLNNINNFKIIIFRPRIIYKNNNTYILLY